MLTSADEHAMTKYYTLQYFCVTLARIGLRDGKKLQSMLLGIKMSIMCLYEMLTATDEHVEDFTYWIKIEMRTLAELIYRILIGIRSVVELNFLENLAFNSIKINKYKFQKSNSEINFKMRYLKKMF